MAGHSRLKDGVASLAYVPAIPTMRHGAQSIVITGTGRVMTTRFVAPGSHLGMTRHQLGSQGHGSRTAR
jgi:hypothetical protein